MVAWFDLRYKGSPGDERAGGEDDGTRLRPVGVMPAVDPAVGGVLTLGLGAIFAWSGAMKLAHLERFEGAVAAYRVLPRRSEKAFARTVPLCECAGAAGLLVPSTRAFAVVGLLSLLCLFSGAIAINLLRGRAHIDCGCFGPGLRQALSGWLLARNAVLVILAVAVGAPRALRPTEWLDAVTVWMGAATLVILYASANHALGNLPRTRGLEAP